MPVPEGPVWAIAIGIVFSGLALLLKAAPPVVQALRKSNGGNDALGRAQAVAEIKRHMDEGADEARESRDKIMTNIDTTRHSLAQPLTTATLSLALIQQTLEQIRDRLPARRGDI